MDDFDLRFVQMYERLNAENMESISDEEYEKRSLASDRAFHAALQKRGRVLTMAAELENLTSDCIVDSFIPEDGVRQDRFRIDILEKESYSFYAKYLTLKNIHEAMGKTEPHPTWNKIESLIQSRNIFAHGRILVDWETQAVFIKHSRGRDNFPEKFDKFWEDYSVSWPQVFAFRQRIQSGNMPKGPVG